MAFHKLRECTFEWLERNAEALVVAAVHNEHARLRLAPLHLAKKTGLSGPGSTTDQDNWPVCFGQVTKGCQVTLGAEPWNGFAFIKLAWGKSVERWRLKGRQNPGSCSRRCVGENGCNTLRADERGTFSGSKYPALAVACVQTICASTNVSGEMFGEKGQVRFDALNAGADGAGGADPSSLTVAANSSLTTMTVEHSSQGGKERFSFLGEPVCPMRVVEASCFVQIVVYVRKSATEFQQRLTISCVNRPVLFLCSEKRQGVLLLTHAGKQPSNKLETRNRSKPCGPCVKRGMDEPQFAIGVPRMSRPVIGYHVGSVRLRGLLSSFVASLPARSGD